MHVKAIAKISVCGSSGILLLPEVVGKSPCWSPGRTCPVVLLWRKQCLEYHHWWSQSSLFPSFIIIRRLQTLYPLLSSLKFFLQWAELMNSCPICHRWDGRWFPSHSHRWTTIPTCSVHASFCIFLWLPFCRLWAQTFMFLFISCC